MESINYPLRLCPYGIKVGLKKQTYIACLWIEKISHLQNAGLSVLEGQVCPTVIEDAPQDDGYSAIHVNLIDCSHAERQRRLIKNRAQPGGDKVDMYAWAAYLHGKADALELEILDKNSLTFREPIQKLAQSICHLAEDSGINLDRCSWSGIKCWSNFSRSIFRSVDIRSYLRIPPYQRDFFVTMIVWVLISKIFGYNQSCI